MARCKPNCYIATNHNWCLLNIRLSRSTYMIHSYNMKPTISPFPSRSVMWVYCACFNQWGVSPLQVEHDSLLVEQNDCSTSSVFWYQLARPQTFPFQNPTPHLPGHWGNVRSKTKDSSLHCLWWSEIRLWKRSMCIVLWVRKLIIMIQWHQWYQWSDLPVYWVVMTYCHSSNKLCKLQTN